MKKQVLTGLTIVLLSTLSYYVPSLFIETGKIGAEKIPESFYNLYVFKLAGSFFLNALYASIIFLILDPKKLVLKLVFCWLMIAESFTLVSHLFDKLYRQQLQNSYQLAGSLFIFGLFCGFFIYRGIRDPETEEFRPNRTYLIRKKPKNFTGVLNYLWNHSGHNSFYQDGKIYAFKRSTGRIEERQATRGFFDSSEISLKEIPTIRNIEKLVGKKYNILTFNCNHLKRYATSGT